MGVQHHGVRPFDRHSFADLRASADFYHCFLAVCLHGAEFDLTSGCLHA